MKIKNHWSHHFIDICPRTFDKVVFLPYESLWTITMSRRVSCYLRISIAVMSDCQSASSPLLLGHFRSSFKETTKVYHTYIKGHLCKRLRRNQSNSTGMLNSSLETKQTVGRMNRMYINEYIHMIQKLIHFSNWLANMVFIVYSFSSSARSFLNSPCGKETETLEWKFLSWRRWTFLDIMANATWAPQNSPYQNWGFLGKIGEP